MNTNFLVIEDDKNVAKYINEVLTDYGYIVNRASTGIEGMDLVKKFQPNLVILDLKLPDISGESVCQQIKQEFPEIKVIILTAKDTPESISYGLNLGADDYIAKPFDANVLLARIKARLRYEKLDKKMLKIDNLVLNPSSHQVIRDNKQINLSAQEYKLLNYLMINQDKVLSREMILNRIWGDVFDIQTRVVDVYIGYLRKKIDKEFNPKLIKSIRGFGYMLTLN